MLPYTHFTYTDNHNHHKNAIPRKIFPVKMIKCESLTRINFKKYSHDSFNSYDKSFMQKKSLDLKFAVHIVHLSFPFFAIHSQTPIKWSIEHKKQRKNSIACGRLIFFCKRKEAHDIALSKKKNREEKNVFSSVHTLFLGRMYIGKHRRKRRRKSTHSIFSFLVVLYNFCYVAAGSAKKMFNFLF